MNEVNVKLYIGFTIVHENKTLTTSNVNKGLNDVLIGLRTY